MPARAETQPEGLSVRNLSVRFGDLEVVKGLSMDVGRERVAIVGESGSGKSMTGRAILGVSPPSARISADRLAFKDIDLLALSERQRREIRGRRLAMILQDPRYSLHPVMTVGAQVAEAFRCGRREATERALAMLAAVRIDDPRRIYGLYPHEISGGMGQRVMIAMMLAMDPEFIIADEPTSALDVVVRLQVLAILDDMVSEKGLGLLFISHDLNLVRSFCDRVLVMYRGRIVERIAAKELDAARHPYTRALLAAVPSPDGRARPLVVPQRDASWMEPVE